MGLFESLSAGGRAFLGPAPRQSFTLTVTGTSGGARVRLVRLLTGPGVHCRVVGLHQAGFYGRCCAPARPRAGSLPVLLFGGSAGGLASAGLTAGLLASRGYRALALAYFRQPGLPAVLERIPLEYFARAARWLRGAGHGRVAVWGVSRGSEPALLLAASYPRLAGAVIAGSPISVVNGAFSWAHPLPPGLPAWTLRGRPLPVARPAGDPASRGNPAAVIPVERIRGPVLLLAGAADKLWPSAACAAATMHRLAAHHDWFPHRDLLLAGAGHAAGLAFPCDAASTAGLGGTRIATSAAETVACHAVLRFLATAGRYRVAG